MELFRISREDFSSKLFASGKANRWNMDGQYVIYAGSSRSLSTLETIVHKSHIAPASPYKVMVISVPDDDALRQVVKIKDLPDNWRSLSAYADLQRIGDQWYQKNEYLLLKVPSAVIPQEYNYVINTKHPEFKSVKLVRREPYFWDDRLL
jgi:RES domain-containing protein